MAEESLLSVMDKQEAFSSFRSDQCLSLNPSQRLSLSISQSLSQPLSQSLSQSLNLNLSKCLDIYLDLSTSQSLTQRSLLQYLCEAKYKVSPFCCLECGRILSVLYPLYWEGEMNLECVSFGYVCL